MDIRAIKGLILSEINLSILPLAVVAAPTSTTPRDVCLRRGFRCAAARLTDESKSDTSGYGEHHQARSAQQDAAAASQDDATSYASAEEASRPNTRLVKEKNWGEKRGGMSEDDGKDQRSMSSKILVWFWMGYS